GRWLPALLVNVDGDTAPVVTDRAGAIGVHDDLDRIAEPGESFVDRIVDDFVHEMVQAIGARVADVHRAALADGLQPFENLDIAGRLRPSAHAAASPPPCSAHPPPVAAGHGSGVVTITCSAASSR